MAPKMGIQSLKPVVWWLEKIVRFGKRIDKIVNLTPPAIEISFQNNASKRSAILLFLQETLMAKSKRGESGAKSIIGGTFSVSKKYSHCFYRLN